VSYQPNPALGEVFVKILDIERKITAGGTKLLGLQNEKRSLVLEARKLELAGREEHEIFKLRYHHAVEDVKTAELAMEDASRQHKRTKEEHDDALELLTKLEEKTEEQQEEEAAIAAEAALPIVQIDQDAETWRSLPLDTLKLSAAILAKLANPIHKHSDKSLGEVTTLGGLADLLNKHQLSYGQLKGMSSATAGKIEEAWMEFWESRKHLNQFAPAVPQPGDPHPEPMGVFTPTGETQPGWVEVEVLLTHGATKKVTAALRAGAYAQISQLETIIEDDDLLGDVVGKKAIKNLRLAYQSWKAMQVEPEQAEKR
jgi:hypothetical protein